MTDISNFMQNLNLWYLIDLFFLLAVAVLIGVFFFKKRNLPNAFVFYAYMFIYICVAVGYYLLGGTALFFALTVCKFAGIFLICAFCAVYQNDLKNIFARIGREKTDDTYDVRNNSEDELVKSTAEIVKACQHMSKNDIGALIIVCPTTVPLNIVATGTKLECLLSSQVLESIFNGKSPLHDGAVIVKGGYIVAAGCFLPLTENPEMDKNLGTRHRAAVGITEQTDVLSVVVSEETGIISVVKGGAIRRYMTSDKLTDALSNAFGITRLSAEGGKKDRRKN